MRFFGDRPTDAGARAFARSRGERALASTTARDGVALVATEQAIHVGDRRFPWDRVARATWDSDEGVLTLVGGADPTGTVQTLQIGLDASTRFLEVVRLEVTSNIVVSQRIESAGFGGAWVTARRVPGEVDLRWSVVFDPGRDPRDPALRAWADENVAVIRRSTGV